MGQSSIIQSKGGAVCGIWIHTKNDKQIGL